MPKFYLMPAAKMCCKNVLHNRYLQWYNEKTINQVAKYIFVYKHYPAMYNSQPLEYTVLLGLPHVRSYSANIKSI